MRNRMTRRRVRKPTARSVMAEIERLEAVLAVDDAELESDADAIAKEEADIAEDSTGYSVDMGEDQNDKAMDNWPVAGREAVASRLLRMAALLLEE